MPLGSRARCCVGLLGLLLGVWRTGGGFTLHSRHAPQANRSTGAIGVGGNRCQDVVEKAERSGGNVGEAGAVSWAS